VASESHSRTGTDVYSLNKKLRGLEPLYGLFSDESLVRPVNGRNVSDDRSKEIKILLRDFPRRRHGWAAADRCSTTSSR
jgi:hypothetical protein